MSFSRLASFIVFCAVLTFSVPSYAEAGKIAVVNVSLLLTDSAAAKSLKEQAQKQREAFQKEFSKHDQELSEAREKIVDQDGKLKPEEKAKKIKDYEAKRAEAHKLFQTRQNAYDRGMSKALTEIRKNIMTFAGEVAKEKGIDVVLKKESVVIVEESLDITPLVLKKMDKKLKSVKLTIKE